MTTLSVPLHPKTSAIRDALAGYPVRRVALVVAVLCLALIKVSLSHAQSFSIDFDESDLDIFFDWFNMMFNIVLPIALIGAGIVAGGGFVWVVSSMLARAFTNMLSNMRSG